MKMQRLVSAELHPRTIKNFKEVLQQQQDIERRIEFLKLYLKDESQCCDEKADRLENLDSLHEK